VFPEKTQAKADGGDSRISCAACGNTHSRSTSKYCPVCGKLMSEDYQPLDAIRSSYGMQRKTLTIEKRAAAASPLSLFAVERNAMSDTAWACVVYSMVPYLGILFVPLAVVIGGIGYAVARRQPHLGGKRIAIVSIGLSFGILIVQIFLWWLLYIIPEIGI
jgi:hypothetical protein